MTRRNYLMFVKPFCRVLIITDNFGRIIYKLNLLTEKQNFRKELFFTFFKLYKWYQIAQRTTDFCSIVLLFMFLPEPLQDSCKWRVKTVTTSKQQPLTETRHNNKSCKNYLTMIFIQWRSSLKIPFFPCLIVGVRVIDEDAEESLLFNIKNFQHNYH